MIASTAYLELFIRRTTEPSMIATFLKFLLTERHDDKIILESLIARINSMSRVGISGLYILKKIPLLGKSMITDCVRSVWLDGRNSCYFINKVQSACA